jgi:hypothetical protein
MDILAKLAGGDRRSIGRANEVVELVLNDPTLLESIFDGMLSPDPVVRMRAADVVEKVSARRPDLVQPLVGRLLAEAARIDQQEVQWHVAQILPRLRMTEAQRRRAEALLLGYLRAPSSIVKVSAMTALANLATGDPALRDRVAPLLADLTRTGTASMRARGRLLRARLWDRGDTDG